MKSATHNWFGRVARNCRSTRSAGRAAARSGTVVLQRLPHTAPRRPRRRISRPTVQRATGTASRLSCFQVLRTPYTSKFSCHALDFRHQRQITPHPGWQPGWVALPGLGLVVRRRGDRQLGADRLDPVLGPVGVDERHHHFAPRSNSACARKADALRRISLARLSCRFSCSNCLSRSRSARRTQRRSRLPRAAQLARDRTQRLPLRVSLTLLLGHEPNRPLPKLGRVPLRCCAHDSSSQSKESPGNPARFTWPICHIRGLPIRISSLARIQTSCKMRTPRYAAQPLINSARAIAEKDAC